MSQGAENVVGWFDYVTDASVWVTLLGLPLAILGLWWTWLAKRSAANAERSASSAVTAVRNLDMSLDLNILTEKMRDLKESMRQRDGEKITLISSDMRRSIVKLRSDAKFSSIIDPEKISGLVTFFGTIESNFGGQESDAEFDLAAFNLQEDCLIEIREAARKVVENEKL